MTVGKACARGGRRRFLSKSNLLHSKKVQKARLCFWGAIVVGLTGGGGGRGGTGNLYQLALSYRLSNDSEFEIFNKSGVLFQ